MIRSAVRGTIAGAGIFREPGAHVLVDGQYGSTGKGLFAGALAEYDSVTHHVDVVTTNAGPNSGHTYVTRGPDGGEVVEIQTQQIPVFSCVAARREMTVKTVLNAGAVVNPDTLAKEITEYGVRVAVHPHAAKIDDKALEAFKGDSLEKIASTGKGVGEAMANKVMRAEDAVIGDDDARFRTYSGLLGQNNETVFVETAQGLSLGLNSGFYPYCTSRECTVAQALSDARISPKLLRSVAMTLRTFPIRVGNTEKGYSGHCFPDQEEISWESINQKPELTTVTKRERRLFTWSWEQYEEGLRVNQPDLIFLNFCNYVNVDSLISHVDQMRAVGKSILGHAPAILLGFGPYTDDIYTAYELMRGDIPELKFGNALMGV